MTPSAERRRTHFTPPRPLPRGLDGAAWSLARFCRRPGTLAGLRREAETLLNSAAAAKSAGESEIREKLAALRRERRLPEADALPWMIVAMQRAVGLWAHPEQVMAALALARGFLVEAATGEGKTLTVGLAGALAAWRAPVVHVVTANDYLAARDAAWLQPFYTACGLSAGCVTGEMAASERAARYANQVTYTTAKELVADFLRDRLQLGPLSDPTRRLVDAIAGKRRRPPLVLRGLFSAIVDEADHALIDDAVTPLIISRKQPNLALQAACLAANVTAGEMQRGTDYIVDPQFHEIRLSPSGEAKSASAQFHGIWSGALRRRELITQALQAREFYRRGHQYLVVEGKVVIVDESTGRQMPQRSWRGGLHQAVEAKEGLAITDPSETLARLSFQRFFRFFRHLAGITGTAREAAAEFWRVYRLPMVAVPTHRPCIREQWPDRLFSRAADKWSAIVAEIEDLHRSGRPILAGTRSVAASEHLATLLTQRRLPFEILNAEQHRAEAAVIERAGERARITIATNMAGRGADIRLGAGVAGLGGLHVIATEKHESRRVDRQLYGRAGRQGDPGSARAFACFEDDLLLKHAPAWLRERAARALDARLPGAEVFASKIVDAAQRRAGRRAAAQRQRLLEQDLSLDETLAFAGAEI